MATAPNPPSQYMRRVHRGRVAFQTRRGRNIVMKWPRKRGPSGTPAQLQARADFTRMVRAVQDMLPEDHSAAHDLAAGCDYTWRDVLSRVVTGQFIVMDNWLMTTIPFYLDAISDVVGALLVRTPDGWVGLLPGDEAQALRMTDGLPAWGEAPGSAIDILVNGDVPVGIMVAPDGSIVGVPL